MAQAKKDQNFVSTLLGVSNVDNLTPVVITADPVTGHLQTDASVSIAANSSININQWGGTGTTLGQKAMAASVPVVFASDQSALSITGSITATNPSVSATGSAVPSSATYLGFNSGGNLTAVTLGQQTAANSIPVILPSATISTLTPPTNTGYALDASLTTLNTSVNTLLKPASTLTAVTTVTTVATLTNQSQEGGVNISLNAGAVDTGTRRVVQANGAGKTIVSLGGSASTSGNNTLVAAGTNKLKVFAFSLSCVSTTSLLCIFQSGAGGTELWRVRLQAATSTSTGANLSVSPPAWLFATASATLLNLNLSSAQAVDWSVSYFDEA